MAFRGRGGRPPRGRGFRGRGRGRGRGGFRGGRGGRIDRSRSRSRSRSPSRSKHHSRERPSSSTSRDHGDSNRRSSRDRDSRDRHDRKEKHGRESHSISSEKSRKKRDRSRSASPTRRTSQRSGHDYKSTSRSSYDKNLKKHRSHSPPSNRSRETGRSPGYRDSPRHSHESKEYQEEGEEEEFYSEGPSGFYDDLDPPDYPSRSRWDSPDDERDGSPRQGLSGDSPSRRSKESPPRGQTGDFRPKHAPKYRGSGAAAHSLQTESLRITVGNERFQGKTAEKEEKHLSAMERLGPPVGQEFQSSDLDDLYQDLPPPAPIPSIPQERKKIQNFSIGNTTPLRDESTQKNREKAAAKGKSKDKHLTQSDEGRRRGSSIDKDKSRDKEKDRIRESRSKRSKERDHDSDKAKSKHREHDKDQGDKHLHDKGRRTRESDYKAHSRERSYERENENDYPQSHSEFRPSDHHEHGQRQPGGIPPQVIQNPSMDPEFNQATLLVQSIRQSTSRAAAPQQYPVAPGSSQPVGSSSGQPPHTGAPYAQQAPGGADGIFHQSSQGSYTNAPGGYYKYQQQQPHQLPHQYIPASQQQTQAYPLATQPPPQQYTQSGETPQPSAVPIQGPPSTEFHTIPPPHAQSPALHSASLAKVDQEKKPLDVNFGSVDEEDLFLYGDSGESSQGKMEKKSEPTHSTEDFWQRRAGTSEKYVPKVKPQYVPEVKPQYVPEVKPQYVPEVKPQYIQEAKPQYVQETKLPPEPVPKKEEKSADIEDDQIKKILSVIGFDFDLAKKIADQKKQLQEEEELRRQARASKKPKPPSVRPQEEVLPPQNITASEVPQAIQSVTGNSQMGDGYHENWGNPPAASFNPTSSFLDSGLHAATTTTTETDSSLDSIVHEAKQNVTQSQLAYQHERMPVPPPQGTPVQTAYQHGVQPNPQYDSYGRPLPQGNFPPAGQPYPPTSQQYCVQPQQNAAIPSLPQGYAPTTSQSQNYFPDQSGSQYQPLQGPQQGHQVYENHPNPVTSGPSSTYPPPHDYQQSTAHQQHSPKHYSSGSSRSSSSERSSSGSETPERTPPKRSRDRSRSHSQSIGEHSEEREYRGKSSRRDDKDEYGPELPSKKEGSPRRIVLMPKSEREESSRKRNYEEVQDRDSVGNLDKLKDLERAELKKLRQLYKDEREALDKKRKKEEEKERVLEEKKLQQAIKRKEAERRKERELEAKKRQAVEKKKKEEAERKRKAEEKERREEERRKKEEEKQRKIQEAQERARQIKLAQDKHIYSKRLEALESALVRLRKQEGELLRKKQREKAGHKDPILAENSKLQDEITVQLKELRVAYTEGRVQHVKFEEAVFTEEIKLREKAFDKLIEEADARKAKERDERKSSKSSKSKSASTDEERAERQPFQFTYNDPGNHWCKLCKLSLQSLNNLFIHLHSKKHMQKCDPYCRPWVPDDLSTKKPKGSTVSAPLGGAEFMMPVNAFYCKLCREFSGDGFCASEHLKSVKHNIKYQKFIEENPNYVKKLEIERAADEKPADAEAMKEEKIESAADDKGGKKDEKGKIKVDIGQRGGFGKFRFLKKEDKGKEGNSKNEMQEVKKEIKNESETALELRKSETPKQQFQSDKEKESTVGKEVKKDSKITIKLSGRQFVPHSVGKAASVPPPKVTQGAIKSKAPPTPTATKPKAPVHLAGGAIPKGKQGLKAEPHSSSTKTKHGKDSLDSFLSIGGQGKSLPVIKEVEKSSLPSQDQIAEAFSGKTTTDETPVSSSKPNEESTEENQKPSFSDTLRKMLFSGTKEEGDVPEPDTSDNHSDLPQPKRPPGLKTPEKKSEAQSVTNVFNSAFAGSSGLPGIPGIDDDELKPPGTS